MAEAPTLPKLLLSEKEAADALGICPRTLWGLMKARQIRCVRIGRRVLYDPRDLQAWIDRKKG